MKPFSVLLLSTILLFSNGRAQTRIWEQTNGPYGGDLRSMAVSPDGVVYAASTPSYGPDGGLSRSSDFGQTWTSITAPDVYLQEIIVTQKGMLVVASDTSLFRLDSSGTTWTNITNGLRFGGGRFNPLQLAMISETQEALFVSIYNDGLYKSSNYGDSWIRVDTSDTV